MEFREIAHGGEDYHAACRLRDRILRRPLGMNLFDEDLAAEEGYVHLAGFDRGGALVAYLHLKPLGDGLMKMQQVAVDEAWQGRGIGRGLAQSAEALAAGRGAEEIVLHARASIAGFYDALGYRREGERFLEIGIEHWRMRKVLLSAG